MLNNQHLENLSVDQHRFIEDMGQHMVGWGVARNTGRVFAYLLLKAAPATLDQIADDLEIAKSGASVATRQLVAFGLARAHGQRGSRRLLFEALSNLDAIFGARNAQGLDLLNRIRQGAAVAPAGPQRERLEHMAGELEEVFDLLPTVLKQIRERRQR